jgi:LmbE family N-acetylglucosaminyl deacetylase
MTFPNPKKMLAILAHPDDESFAIGGTLAKYAHEGIQVVLLCATRGEAGIQGKGPEETGQIREMELLEAARFLGIEVYFLDYMDGKLASENTTKLNEHIACWIDTVQPQVILTFGPDGVSGHPDHVTVSHIVTQVVDQYFPHICLLYIAPSEATVLGCGVSDSIVKTEKPLISVDISEYKMEKIRAIQSHVSQEPPLKGKPEEELDQIPCHEYFSVAHSINCALELNECFSPAKEYSPS